MSLYFMPTVNLIGAGCVNEAGNRVKDLGGSKVLLVTNEGLINAGIAEKVEKILKNAGIKVVIFDEALPNPTDKNVEDGFKIWQTEKCDALVSLGGGSSHDCAKGIGLLAANGGKIHDYEGVDKSSKPMVPLICINTTAGTAAEMSRFCIITDTSRKV
ncbi:iron-containing alcohol dehydrogenase, partial [Peptococcaceae bacterium]|nr:iron-containing alcohol dehydrogenase [Peptococcaceae bacterium]